MAERPSWAVSDSDGIITVEDARVAVGAGYTTDGQAVADKRSGFLPSVGDPGAVTASATADTFVHTAPFQRVTQSSRGNGPYVQTLDTQKDIDILGPHPADSTNDRHDLIVAQQSDAFYGDADSAFTIRHVVGTPATSPTDPTVDGSPDYYELARIRVAAGSTVIDDADIDDLRPPEVTVAVGGVIPVASASVRDAIPNPYGGLTVWRQDRDWTETWDGTSWRTHGNLVVSSESDLSAISSPYTGQLVTSLDDGLVYRYDGSSWTGAIAVDGTSAATRHEARYEKPNSQDIANFAFSQVSYPSVRYDSEDITPNGAATEFTINRSGLWVIHSSLTFGGAAGSGVYLMYLADVADTITYVDDQKPVNPDSVRLGFSAEWRFTAGDVVTVFVNQQSDDSALPIGGGTQSFLTLQWIRP